MKTKPTTGKYIETTTKIVMISENLTADAAASGNGLELEPVVMITATTGGFDHSSSASSSSSSSSGISGALAKLSSPGTISTIPFTQLKPLMRNISIGLNDPCRRILWLEFSLRHSRLVNADEFDTQFDNLSANKLPNFVDPTNARFFYLNDKARRHAATILWNLSQSYPQMTFAPLIYPLVCLFLHFHTPADVYRSIVALLTARETRFIGTNKIDKCKDALILITLAKEFRIAKRSRPGSNLAEKFQDSDAAFVDWIQWIFGCLPFHFCVRIVDCYLVEGEKFLYRVALALAQQFEKRQRDTITLEKMRNFCENISTVLTPSQLIHHAVKINRFSRKDIIKARTKAEKKSKTTCIPESPLLRRKDIISSNDVTFGTRIAPRKFKSSILSWNQLDLLWDWIPDRICVLEPLVVFCSDENGNSLRTFYALCGENEPTILLVKTLNNEIFGAYCSSSWSKRFDGANKSGQYFGNGETFLFTIAPRPVKYDWVGKYRDANQLTPSQQLFMSATGNYFSVGGGGSGHGLYIDENLSRGETHRCDTFENEPLTFGDSYFDVAVIEIIAFC